MTKYLVAFTFIDLARNIGFGNATIISLIGKMTPAILEEATETLKKTNNLSSITVMGFSKFDEEETL